MSPIRYLVTNKILSVSDLITPKDAVEQYMDKKTNSRRPKIDHSLRSILAR